ncbi:MAG TPA: pyridoxal 5'-phosphate synthase glutaminase subunit PdxT [Bryobacteraceae bacterium]|nr:pyridoxal 5'-phosphate synthase glutaminase subunit PdxT [Bryobacteraceae bacterium]
MKRVGVLSLQGDFAAHGASLERAGAEPVFVRDAGQLAWVDGLIIPGGESTTMLKLLRFEGWLDKLAEFGRRKPIFGTCAGAILLASDVSNPPQESLGLMDLGVERNAYGRQVDSRVASLDPAPEFERRTAPGKLEAVFIRAPIIRRAASGVMVLARYAGDPVLVEQGRHLAATFHPELTGDRRVHQLFLEKL